MEHSDIKDRSQDAIEGPQQTSTRLDDVPDYPKPKVALRKDLSYRLPKEAKAEAKNTKFLKKGRSV